jgi:hypothetical protein
MPEREPARALGFEGDRHSIEIDELPARLQRLSVREAEDPLCIHKSKRR